MTAPLVTRDRPASRWERLSARFRRAYDAEVLRYLPEQDEAGKPRRRNCVVPVRHGLGQVLDPVKLFFALPLMAAWIVPSVIRVLTRVPDELLGEPHVLTYLAAWGIGGLVTTAFWTVVVRRVFRSRLQRMALDTYHRYRWQDARRMDAVLEQERSPRRLAVPSPAALRDG